MPMRLYLNCLSCFHEHGVNDPTTYSADLLDEGVAVFECRRGHKVRTALQAFKFEILSEVAITAIADGYYREAVSSFTSALERFYEFYVRVILKSKDHNENEIQGFWRKISKQSERQLGAFHMLYMTEEGAPPDALKDEDVSFRNKVIHQGLVPTRKEAIDYGQKVVNVAHSPLERLKAEHSDLIEQLAKEALIEKSINLEQDERSSTLGMPRILNASGEAGGEPKSVADWIEHVKPFKNAMRGAAS